MPFRCVAGDCPHKSWVRKTLKYHAFPTDEKLRRKWISAVSYDEGITSGRRVIEAVVHTFEEGVNMEATIFPLFFQEEI